MNEEKLGLATLQLLSKSVPKGGLSGVMIAECIGLNNVIELEPTLLWLLGRSLIETGECEFLITENGVLYLQEQMTKRTDDEI
jgi:hypothetical protein